MTFLTILMSVIVFVAVSVLFGTFWFYTCGWNESLRARDFRVLAVSIPVTVFLMFFFVGAPVKMAGLRAADPVPSPEISPAPVKKHKKKRIKKEEETDSQVELPPRRSDDDESRNQEQEGEGQRD